MSIPTSAQVFRPESGRGVFPFEQKIYGKSVEGVPLRYLPAAKETRLLIFAAIHGEEPETTFLLSRALRMLSSAPDYVACILAANPDGLLRGTRSNARGIDLNRNFPTANWKSGPTFSRAVLEAERITRLGTGDFPASEPETSSLISLIEKLNVKKVIALHSPLGWIDSDIRTELSRRLEKAFGLSWQAGSGYPTPGSFGTFAAERNLECVTVELPRLSPEELSIRYAENLAGFLAGFR